MQTAVETKIAEVYEEMNGGNAVSTSELRDAVWSNIAADEQLKVILAFEALCGRIRAFMNSHKADPEDVSSPAQFVLPGFEDCWHLQKAYCIERNGERVIVPILKMEPDEMRVVASSYRRMASGCNAHADELDRVADWLESIEI